MQNYTGLSPQSHSTASFIHCAVLVQSLTLSGYFALVIIIVRWYCYEAGI